MNRQQLAFVFVLLVMSISLAACAGFDLGDLIRVKTPPAVQQTTGLPSQLSLNDAELEYRAWLTRTSQSGASWRSNIERAGEIRSLFNQLTLSALDTVGPTIAGVPMLGPALPALTGLLGVFVGGGRLRKEKEASFNKGLRTGKELKPNES